MKLKKSKSKAGRPEIENRKQSYTVCLRPSQQQALVCKYKTLTEAIRKLLPKNQQDI